MGNGLKANQKSLLSAATFTTGIAQQEGIPVL
jgi:hypothetical protein